MAGSAAGRASDPWFQAQACTRQGRLCSLPVESLKTAFQGMSLLSSSDRGFFPCLVSSRIGLPRRQEGTSHEARKPAPGGTAADLARGA